MLLQWHYHTQLREKVSLLSHREIKQRNILGTVQSAIGAREREKFSSDFEKCCNFFFCTNTNFFVCERERKKKLLIGVVTSCGEREGKKELREAEIEMFINKRKKNKVLKWKGGQQSFELRKSKI